jgi:outer membrane protein assembly factor BamB
MKAFLWRHQRLEQHRPKWIALVGACMVASCGHGQPYWPQFRGPTGAGISPSARPPISFGVRDAVWATEVPPGHSSPCVWGNRIFLTTFAEGKLECRAYDRAKGTQVWAKPVEVEQLEKTHPFSNPAAPTPAADGEHVVFYFGSYGLLAYSHEGRLLWDKKLPAPVSRGNYGSGSSPVLYGDLVIQALDTDEGGSRLFAFRRATGEKAWETARPLFACGWSTPVVWTHGGKPEIVLLGSKKLVAYEPAEGKELWSAAGFPLETVPSPACDEERVYACSAGIGGRTNPKFEAFGLAELLQFDANKDGKVQLSEVPESYRFVQRPELPEGHPGRVLPFPARAILEGMDKNKDGVVSQEEWDQAIAAFEQVDTPVLMALRPGSPDKSETNLVAWQLSRGIPETPSPLCYRGKVYLVRDGGLLQCLDSVSGTVLYQERLGVLGGYSASPVAADDRVYLASQSGTVTVVDARERSLKVLARNALGEKITATPALVEDKLYVRTEKHLFAFGGR